VEAPRAALIGSPAAFPSPLSLAPLLPGIPVMSPALIEERRRAWSTRRRSVGILIVLAAAVAVVLVVASAWPARPPTVALPHTSTADPSFPATVEAYAGAPVLGGNRVTPLFNGDAIFPAKLAVIRSAVHTLNYAEYFYADGDIASVVAQALIERCQAGVRVNILLDGVGTLSMPAGLADDLRAAGCRVQTFRPVRRVGVHRENDRNHRRILVADGRVGMTGGSGVSWKWTGNGRTEEHWRDTDARVEGPAVAWLQAAFAENWREATGELLGGRDYFPELAPHPDGIRAQLVRSSASVATGPLATTYLLAIDGAERSIHLTNPYFLPDTAMGDALLRAARRGVDVVALLPGKIDHNTVRAASRQGFGRLLRGGVRIFEYHASLLHAKTMVVDSRWATIGSANFDPRSFKMNDELNLVVYDGGVAGRVEAAFQEDLRYAREVTYEAWRARGIGERLQELVVFPIRELL
jgi:cardiolipin synthase